MGGESHVSSHLAQEMLHVREKRWREGERKKERKRRWEGKKVRRRIHRAAANDVRGRERG